MVNGEALAKHFGATLAAIFGDETGRYPRDVVEVRLKDAAKRAGLHVCVAAKLVKLWPLHGIVSEHAGLDVSYERPRKAGGARMRARGRPRIFSAQPARLALRKRAGPSP